MDNLFEYRRDLDALHFTAEQKHALTAQVVSAATSAHTAPRRRPVRRMVVLAAAAAIVLAVGAGATVLKLASESFAPVFGTAQTEIIDKIGRPIDASDTDNGVTITADAIIGDQYNACIVYTVANADGTPLALPEGANLMFAQQSTNLRFQGGSHGSAWSHTESETGTVQYVETISADQPLRLNGVKAEFENICYFDEAAQERKTFLEGKWTLRFQADYEDASVSLPAGQYFTRDGLGFTIDEMILSPVAIRVKYTADQRPDWGNEQKSGLMSEEMQQEQNRFLGGIPLMLTLSDGTTIDLSDNAGGGIHPTETGAECNKGTVFSQILPLEDVLSVTFGDVVIPVSGQ